MPTTNGRESSGAVGDYYALVKRYGIPTPYGSGTGQVLIGKDGADTIRVAGARDAVLSGGGDDWIEAGGSLVPVPVGSYVVAGLGNDRVIGSRGPDRIYGDDIVDGRPVGAGNDQLTGGGGDDALYGGGGNDILRGDDGSDRLFGGDGADQLEGGALDDLLDGGAGDDVLTAGASNLRNISDRLYGGLGSDTLIGAPGRVHSAMLYGGAGNDRILCGAGTDLVRLAYVPSGRDGVDEVHGFDVVVGDRVQVRAPVPSLTGSSALCRMLDDNGDRIVDDRDSFAALVMADADPGAGVRRVASLTVDLGAALGIAAPGTFGVTLVGLTRIDDGAFGIF